MNFIAGAQMCIHRVIAYLPFSGLKFYLLVYVCVCFRFKTWMGAICILLVGVYHSKSRSLSLHVCVRVCKGGCLHMHECVCA